MPTMLQDLADWVRQRRQDLADAIVMARSRGLASGATTAELMEERILLLFQRNGVRSSESATQSWKSLLGDSPQDGSRLTDLAFWMGCEDPIEASRSDAHEDTAAAFLREYRPRIQAFAESGLAPRDAHLATLITEGTFFNVYHYYWSSERNAKYVGDARAIRLLRIIAHRVFTEERRRRNRNGRIRASFADCRLFARLRDAFARARSDVGACGRLNLPSPQ
ncbi:MAG: hypothetical protein AAGG01_09145, partial [Planctomycetota bacterium]